MRGIGAAPWPNAGLLPRATVRVSERKCGGLPLPVPPTPTRAHNRGRGTKCAHSRRCGALAAFWRALLVATGKGTVAVARKGQATNRIIFLFA
jgi:hypothetical protein